MAGQERKKDDLYIKEKAKRRTKKFFVTHLFISYNLQM